MSRGPDAETLLMRALDRHARHTGIAIEIGEPDWRRWASATFTGARHRLTLGMDASDGARAWLAGLVEADLPMRGHLVADLAVQSACEADGRLVAIVEALTVEDR